MPVEQKENQRTQSDYKFKTEPYDHQLEVFFLSRDKESFALFMEQRTGKTKVIIDNAAWLYARGKIEAVLVIAPNGMHRDWVDIEIPEHMPEHCPYIAKVFETSNNTKKYKQYIGELYLHADLGLKILSMNVESLSVKKGFKYAEAFTDFYKCLTVVDESTRIKNHKATRAKSCFFVGQQSTYRRILTGTPVTQSPLDLYAQMKFLDREILGYSSHFLFKHHFAKVIKRETQQMIKGKVKRWFYEDIVEYKNMDELQTLIEPYSYRVLKKDCLDLPEKIYKTIRVPLKGKQLQMYAEMKDTFMTEIKEGIVVTAPMALVRLLRLQQILGGYLKDETGIVHTIDDKCNCKLDALVYDLEELPENEAVIIWARFRAEIEGISYRLGGIYGDDACRCYYGGISAVERTQTVKDFKDGKFRFFIGNQQAAGHGITLNAASNVYYYSNDFSLENRLQSEDRCHRIGQRNNVYYRDIICPGTMDVKIQQAFKDKKSMSDMVTGDNIQEALIHILEDE